VPPAKDKHREGKTEMMGGGRGTLGRGRHHNL